MLAGRDKPNRQLHSAVGCVGVCVCGLWICGWGRCHSTAGADADAVADAIAAAVSSN